jgi:hypothetical protein
MQDSEAHAQQHAQYSQRPVLNKHGNGIFIMTAFICITYKNIKPLCNHVSHVRFCEWQQTLLQICLKFCLLKGYIVQKIALIIQAFAILDAANSIGRDIYHFSIT